MEILLICFGLWVALRICRALSASAQAAQEAAVHFRDHAAAMATARTAIADMEQELAALRRDLRDEGGDGPIPAGAPDPLPDFLPRRAAARVDG